MPISETGEDLLISKITTDLPTLPNVIIGPGDDCAVLARDSETYTLLKTDCIVENVHFTPDTEPHRIGWKAAARVISDFAAMGGQPESILVTIILPPDTKTAWVEELYRGIKHCAETYQFSIVGGETSSTSPGSPAIISIAGTGTVPIHNLILRSSAQPGDLIFVTGKLGGSITGKHLDFSPRLPEAQWLTRTIKPSAMMDLSDGIAKDLPRLAAASNTGYKIKNTTIPCNQGSSIQSALTDGEDYELLFTIHPDSHLELLDRWQKTFPDTRLSNIGTITQNPSDNALKGGFDHFHQQ